MLFVSKIKDLRLVRRPSDRIMDEHRNPIVLRGERAEFSNWRYTTNDPDQINWLLHHPLYGVQFTSDKLKDKPTEAPEKMDTGNTIDDMADDQISDMQAIARAKQLVPGLVKDASMLNPNKKFEQMMSDYKDKKKDKKKMSKLPAMVKGVLATAQMQYVNDGKDSPAVEKAPALSREEVAGMINDSVASAMSQILEAIKTQPAKKSAFHCKECGEEFKSGYAVGEHKKTAHAAPTPAPEVTE